jgi:hypothetical protein
MDFRIPLLATALACAGLAHAAPLLSKDEMKATLVRIEEQYDHAQARCKRVQGQARALCNEQARGERDIQVAELDFRNEPTADNDQKVRLAKAEATYSKALVECKEMDGQARDVCRSEAKRSYADAKSEAKLQRQVAEQTLRSENTVRERTAESDRVAQAQYAAARQRCEALPPEGRLNCFEDVKKRFSQF